MTGRGPCAPHSAAAARPRDVIRSVLWPWNVDTEQASGAPAPAPTRSDTSSPSAAMPRGVSGWVVGMTWRSSYFAMASRRYIRSISAPVMPTAPAICSSPVPPRLTSRM